MIVERIRERAESGIDRFGKEFPKYSKSYVNSLDFDIAGKSPSEKNLTLSGDMLAALDVIEISGRKVTVGYDPGTPEADRAEGNIRGTYGQDRGSKAKARDFLGLPDSEIKKISDKLSNDGDSIESNSEQTATTIAELLGFDVPI